MKRQGNMNMLMLRKCTQFLMMSLLVGNDTTNTNTLRLWSAEASDNIPANQDFRQYIQNVRDICQMLY